MLLTKMLLGKNERRHIQQPLAVAAGSRRAVIAIPQRPKLKEGSKPPYPVVQALPTSFHPVHTHTKDTQPGRGLRRSWGRRRTAAKTCQVRAVIQSHTPATRLPAPHQQGCKGRPKPPLASTPQAMVPGMRRQLAHLVSRLADASKVVLKWQ